MVEVVAAVEAVEVVADVVVPAAAVEVRCYVFFLISDVLFESNQLIGTEVPIVQSHFAPGKPINAAIFHQLTQPNGSLPLVLR